MNNPAVLLLAFAVLTGSRRSAEAAPCCPTSPAKAAAAPAPCCPPARPAVAPDAANSLSDRSLYQCTAEWTDDDGRPVSLATLRGRPVVLAMFFASCEYACPVLIDDLRRLQAALPEAARDRAQIVLVSFDSERDSPAALRAFRTRMNLDHRWTLLHGAPAQVRELAMLLGVKYQRDARGQFAHSNLLTILNPEGEIAHQHAGLMGDISPAAQALSRAAQ